MRPPLLVPLMAALALAGASLAAQGSGNREPTLAELEAAAVTDSNDAVVHYRLAMSYWERKRWDDAERALQVALRVAPSYPEAHLALGVLPYRRGDKYWKRRLEREGEERVLAALAGSEAHYRRAFLVNPTVDLAVIDTFDVGVEVLAFVAQGKRRVPFMRFIPWWSPALSKALSDLRAGRNDKAFARLDELTHHRQFEQEGHEIPDLVLRWHGLAAAHLRRFDVAVADFAVLTGRAFAEEQRVEELKPEETDWGSFHTNDYRYLLATMLYLGGDFERAIPTFRRVLEVDLGLYVAHVQLARMYEARGEIEAALAERKLALDVQQDDPDLLVDLASTLIQAGRPAEAVAPLAQAAGLNPRDARIPYLQAMTAETLRDTAAAREAYTRFLATAPSRFGERIAEARERLAALAAADSAATQ